MWGHDPIRIAPIRIGIVSPVLPRNASRNRVCVPVFSRALVPPVLRVGAPYHLGQQATSSSRSQPLA